MSLPLSYDLKVRIVKAVESGASFSSVAKRFVVSRTSVSSCWRLYCETGTVDPLPEPRDDRSLQQRKLKGWRKKQPGLTTDQLCERLVKEGYEISRSTVWRLLNDKNSSLQGKRGKTKKAKGARRKRFYLSHEQLERIRHYFPKARGKPRVNDWRVVSGIIHVLKNGLPWQEAPEEYGPYKTLYNRWKRWCDKGIFLAILLALASRGRKRHVLMLDSTYIKAHRTACSLVLDSKAHGRKIGRTVGGPNSKLHVVTDAKGRPVLLYPTAGNKSDIGGARVLIDALPSGVEKLVADRAYDANWFRNALDKKGIEPCIPPRRNRTEEIDYDRDLYKSRNEVERCIGRLKDWRRVATRYDRCPNVFLNACALAAIFKFWL